MAEPKLNSMKNSIIQLLTNNLAEKVSAIIIIFYSFSLFYINYFLCSIYYVINEDMFN